MKHPAAANAEEGYRDKRARTVWDEKCLQNVGAKQNQETDAGTVGESSISGRSGESKLYYVGQEGGEHRGARNYESISPPRRHRGKGNK